MDVQVLAEALAAAMKAKDWTASPKNCGLHLDKEVSQGLMDEPTLKSFGLAFSNAFFQMLNSSKSGLKFKQDHFWSFCQLEVELIGLNVTKKETCESSQHAARFLSALKNDHNITFEQSENSLVVDQGDCPGQVKMDVHGKIIHANLPVGNFKLMVIFIRDASKDNGCWRIMNTKLKIEEGKAPN